MTLEAPVFTMEAAVMAAEFGVHRIELCSDFGEGGETPSVGSLAYLKEQVSIPIFVMIRPRGGDFFYTDAELEVMRRDIRILKSFGADGFVFGVLDAAGNVNVPACDLLIKEADGVPCTFHRAFDICKDKQMALEDIISCGFKRVLTSGGKNDVGRGLHNILAYIKQAKDRIIIMPGGGLKPEHVSLLKKGGLLKEIHASCKSFRPSGSRYVHPDVQLSNDPMSFARVLTIEKHQVEAFLEKMA
jgi:copper homeostasis protein